MVTTGNIAVEGDLAEALAVDQRKFLEEVRQFYYFTNGAMGCRTKMMEMKNMDVRQGVAINSLEHH
jgi:hypothetical protein